MRTTYLLAASAAAALALAGCNRNAAEQATTNAAATLPDLPATLPLSVGSASVIANAPQANVALPEARPIDLVRTRSPGDAYAYADRAYGFAEALGDAPPDYGFDYDGVEPWAWQAYDDSVSFAEPIDGGYRYYYYRPGAETPYFVRDPYYGYSYDNGALAVVYAADGSIVPYEDYGPRLDYAARYWVRGRDLWAASRRADRRAVIAANWAARNATIEESRARWFESRRLQPDWAAYAAANDARRATYWRAEDVRREADAQRFDRWRREDFRTPPPPRAIPPGWREARWARDPQRYAPAAAAGPAARPIDVARGPDFGRAPGSRIERPGGPGVAARPDARPVGVARGPGGPAIAAARDVRRGGPARAGAPQPERLEARREARPDRAADRPVAMARARQQPAGRPGHGRPAAAESARPDRIAAARPESRHGSPAAERPDRRASAAAARPVRAAPAPVARPGRGPTTAVAARGGPGAKASPGGARPQGGHGQGGAAPRPAGGPGGGAAHGTPGGPH